MSNISDLCLFFFRRGMDFLETDKFIFSSQVSLIDLVSALPLNTLTALGVVTVSRICDGKFLSDGFLDAKMLGTNDYQMSWESKFWHPSHRRSTAGVFLGGLGGRRITFWKFEFRWKMASR